MERIVHSSGPLSGTVELPGDRRIMLLTLALGMTVKGQIVIKNIPPAGWIGQFRDFLIRYGASYKSDDNNTVMFQGHSWPDEVRVTAEVPAEVLHIIAATVLFSGKRIIFEDGVGVRALETERVLDLLTRWGLDRERTGTIDNDLVVDGVVFTGKSDREAHNGQVVETALAVSLAAGQPVTVSYSLQTAVHAIRLAESLGCSIASPEPGGSLYRDHELTRRLARAKGGKALTTVTFGWQTPPDKPIVLPGDSVLAAALCGITTLVPRSRITVRQVVWDQDRRGFFETLKRMKGTVTWESAKSTSIFDTADVTVQWAPLEGVHVTAEQSLAMRSELMLLAVVAAAASDKTVISIDSRSTFPVRDTCNLVAAGICALGAHAGDFEVGIVLNGVPELRGSRLDAAGNPDAALAFAVAALAAAGDTILDGIDTGMPYMNEFFTAVQAVATTSLPLS